MGVPANRIEETLAETGSGDVSWIGRELTEAYFEEVSGIEHPFNFYYDKSRITCFSCEPDNLPMWSHYADGLRGICIEFDQSKLSVPTEAVLVTPVHYSKEPPELDSFVYALIQSQFEFALEHGYEEYEGESFRTALNGMMSLALASKTIEWAYEKEARLILQTDNDDNSPVFHNYPSDAMTGVIVGERMPASYREQLKRTLQNLNLDLPIKVATRAAGEYRLTLQKVEL